MVVSTDTLLYLLNYYLEIRTGENNASSCFGTKTSDRLSYRKLNLFFFFHENPAQWQHEEHNECEAYRDYTEAVNMA